MRNGDGANAKWGRSKFCDLRLQNNSSVHISHGELRLKISTTANIVSNITGNANITLRSKILLLACEKYNCKALRFAKEKATAWVALFFCRVNYASTIAPTGQPSSHAPQSIHSSALITNLPSPSEIALTGQVSAHAPHMMHSSLISLGIVISL